MVKHTQTIRRQQPTSCLSAFNDFVGLTLKGLKISQISVPWSLEACNFIKERLASRVFLCILL